MGGYCVSVYECVFVRVIALLSELSCSRSTARQMGHYIVLHDMTLNSVTFPVGACAQHIAKIEAFIQAHGSNGHAVGNSLTVADLVLFTGSSAFVSGLYDGVPADLFDNLAGISLL